MSALGNLQNDCDAYRIDQWGNVLVRSTGIYSGGASDGKWFEVGDVSDADLMREVDAEIGLRPIHRSYLG